MLRWVLNLEINSYQRKRNQIDHAKNKNNHNPLKIRKLSVSAKSHKNTQVADKSHYQMERSMFEHLPYIIMFQSIVTYYTNLTLEQHWNTKAIDQLLTQLQKLTQSMVSRHGLVTTFYRHCESNRAPYLKYSKKIRIYVQKLFLAQCVLRLKGNNRIELSNQ